MPPLAFIARHPAPATHLSLTVGATCLRTGWHIRCVGSAHVREEGASLKAACSPLLVVGMFGSCAASGLLMLEQRHLLKSTCWLSLLAQGSAWNVGYAAAHLIGSGVLPPFLVVAVDSAGPMRSLNYLPYKPGAVEWRGGAEWVQLRRACEQSAAGLGSSGCPLPAASQTRQRFTPPPTSPHLTPPQHHPDHPHPPAGTGQGGFRGDAERWPGGGCEGYMRRLVTELMPLVADEFGTAADPARVAFGGGSFAGGWLLLAVPPTSFQRSIAGVLPLCPTLQLPLQPPPGLPPGWLAHPSRSSPLSASRATPTAGVTALYAALHYPHVFGSVLAESPSLWIAEGRFLGDLWEHKGALPERLFLGCGTKEYSATRDHER